MNVKKLKTGKTKASVAAYLNSVEDDERRKDAKVLDKLFRAVTGEKPHMWGESIVGYGEYRYTRKSGDEFSFLRTGFSPRKDKLVVYLLPGYEDFCELLEKLGPYKKGKSCLYIKRLEDIHMPTLKKMVKKAWEDMARMYPAETI